MRKFVTAALLLLIGGAGIYWYTGNNLAFKPAQGDTRQFILEQYTELQPSSGRRKGPVRIRIESLLRSEVLAANDGVVTLESRATLAEDAYLPDMFRDMLLRDLSIMSTFQLGQSGFPIGPLTRAFIN